MINQIDQNLPKTPRDSCILIQSITLENDDARLETNLQQLANDQKDSPNQNRKKTLKQILKEQLDEARA